MKFQIFRVKEKILDDSRKKSQISKTSDFSIATMEIKIKSSNAFKLLNDFQYKILYPAKLSIKPKIEN